MDKRLKQVVIVQSAICGVEALRSHIHKNKLVIIRALVLSPIAANLSLESVLLYFRNLSCLSLHIVSLSRYSIPRQACCLGIRLKTDSCLGIRCLGIHSGAKGVIMLFMHLSRYSFENLILSRYSQRGLGYYVRR